MMPSDYSREVMFFESKFIVFCFLPEICMGAATGCAPDGLKFSGTGWATWLQRRCHGGCGELLFETRISRSTADSEATCSGR